MKTQRSILRFGIGPIVSSVILLSGCIHIAPIARSGDKNEAMAFARLLYSMAPEAKELLHDEELTANDLRVTLDEAGSKDLSTYRDKFDAAIQKFVVIRDKRRAIQVRIRQGVWESTLAHLVQRDAVTELQGDLDRTIGWIQLAHNFRLRADLGRLKDFPELLLLNQSLDAFLGETPDEPMSYQIGALRAEYRFKESDLGR